MLFSHVSSVCLKKVVLDLMSSRPSFLEPSFFWLAVCPLPGFNHHLLSCLCGAQPPSRHKYSINFKILHCLTFELSHFKLKLDLNLTLISGHWDLQFLADTSMVLNSYVTLFWSYHIHPTQRGYDNAASDFCDFWGVNFHSTFKMSISPNYICFYPKPIKAVKKWRKN